VPDGQPPLDLFVGREAEVARVAEVVARVAAGQPWLVAIEGDPGMGKTALARRCLTGAAGLRVLSARADQVEADLDFGVVGQLLRSAGGAFGMAGPGGGADPPGSSFAMGARLLEMLGDAMGARLLEMLGSCGRLTSPRPGPSASGGC
jgi:predicted ATPase